MHLLDNPVWQALTGPQRHFGIGDGRARRYQRDISPLAALENPLTTESWAALADIVEVGERIGLSGIRSESVPDGWETEWCYPFLQMICTRKSFRAPSSGTAAPMMRELCLSDGAAMVNLARLTQPGPMEERTVTIGRYLGIFDENASLIAMAGERVRLDGFTEVSGVCTHPDHRGKGYANVLVASLTKQIVERGDTAFLHVKDGNSGAARVYEKLGFSVRAVRDIAALKKVQEMQA
ncbi:GNAT family N-acetyltransferase [Trinickia mobilis]|uniref:GNAT family N-acetyltransferase n=1 Tax=Trinickia mobilis TaxID=2816356 RepID=UPI001A8E200B|nr:GNAT family N-acetyltransferase [Trinickia mobilis]